MLMVKEIAKLLETHGGWGIAALTLVALLVVVRYYAKMMEKRDDQLIEVIRECGSAIDQSNENAKEVEDLLRRVNVSFEQNTKAMERVEDTLNKRRR